MLTHFKGSFLFTFACLALAVAYGWSSTGTASVGGPSVGVSADFAYSKRTTYLDWPSCVPVGR